MKAVFVALMLGGALAAQGDPARRTAPWPAEVVDLASRLPVQEGGRIKPLSTLAHWMLTRINGRAGCRVTIAGAGEQRLTPVEWLLDCLFFPQQAELYEVILVQNSEVLDAIGLGEITKDRRGRYTYAQLLPARMRLDKLAREYAGIDKEQRDGVQNQTLDLHRNFYEYTTMLRFLDPLRERYAVDGSQGLSLLFGGAKDAPFSMAIGRLPALVAMYRELMGASGEAKKAEREAEMAALDKLAAEIGRAGDVSVGLALLPPSDTTAETWLTPADLVHGALHERTTFEAQLPLLAHLERMAALRTDGEAFVAELRALQAGVRAQAEARGEYRKVPIEVAYYRWDFFYRALVGFGLAFLLVVASWLRPRSRILPKAIWVLAIAPTALVIAGIVVRCIVRGRPPVSTIYETIPFITAVGILVCLVIEWINRRRVALPVAVFLGAGGMFLAMRYELADGQDTMPSLVAVLDTNFWLATHVTTVVIGYSAGLLAALLGHVWLFGRMLGLRRSDATFYRNVTRMAYGAICFGLVFSVVGTILGGIWANYSWGRFWGWDPKENGALMIVLWELAMLHARMGGYIRDFGLCMASIFGAIIIAFSWWGVNVMGVGLHSYGFTSGIKWTLYGYYIFESLVLVAGGLYWWFALRRQMASRAA
jgi:ABC-type transport system involved in cytochrome c biogenesis permease subunit